VPADISAVESGRNPCGESVSEVACSLRIGGVGSRLKSDGNLVLYQVSSGSVNRSASSLGFIY
jgi:hypothetical protein